jgi:hypothetical protein
MARKLNNQSGDPGTTTAQWSALSISDWDEGAPYPNGWFRVEITHRHPECPPGRISLQAALYRVLGEASEPSTFPE